MVRPRCDLQKSDELQWRLRICIGSRSTGRGSCRTHDSSALPCADLQGETALQTPHWRPTCNETMLCSVPSSVMHVSSHARQPTQPMCLCCSHDNRPATHATLTGEVGSAMTSFCLLA